jgi:hypothetical protein
MRARHVQPSARMRARRAARCRTRAGLLLRVSTAAAAAVYHASAARTGAHDACACAFMSTAHAQARRCCVWSVAQAHAGETATACARACGVRLQADKRTRAARIVLQSNLQRHTCVSSSAPCGLQLRTPRAAQLRRPRAAWPDVPRGAQSRAGRACWLVHSLTDSHHSPSESASIETGTRSAKEDHQTYSTHDSAPAPSPNRPPRRGRGRCTNAPLRQRRARSGASAQRWRRSGPAVRLRPLYRATRQRRRARDARRTKITR